MDFDRELCGLIRRALDLDVDYKLLIGALKVRYEELVCNALIPLLSQKPGKGE